MSTDKRQRSDSLHTKDKRERIQYRVLFRIYKVFGRHYKKYWKQLLLAFSALLATIAISLIAPWPLKMILDYVILRNPLPEEASFLNRWFGEEVESLLLALVAGYIILRLLDTIVSYIHKVGVMATAAKILADIRERIFVHLHKLSLSFHSAARSGDLLYRFTQDTTVLNTILIQVPQNLAYRLIMIGSIVTIMLFIDWRLALSAFSVIPIIYLFHRHFGSGVQEASRQKRSKESDVTSLAAENVEAMTLVQAYGREDSQQARFEAENRASLRFGLTAMRLSKAFKRLNKILVAAGTAGVVYYGGRLALEGEILPGTIVLFASYLRKLYGPVEKFASMMLDIAKSQVAGERILELIECDLVVRDDPYAVPAPQLTGRIQYHNVSFGYKKDVNVLKNVNFVAESGQTVALVGPSGVGKSTLVSLLLRFYQPETGHITINEQPINKFQLGSLRAQITVLMQEAELFNQTIRENIAFGKEGATDEEILKAARLAQAHDFISELPREYDSVISEGGENLSGGQKQRINIARAIIRNTPILILDEPASALDAKTEALVQKALGELIRGKTTFLIAHKLASVINADKILVLEQGQIIAQGTHQKLLSSCKEYRELFELQNGKQINGRPMTDGDGRSKDLQLSLPGIAVK